MPHGQLPSAYASYFACFNRGEFFRAHEVLEGLWLQVRREPIGDFYKGLIQLAGAFVHVEKGRRQPALALLGLADRNLAKYSEVFEMLDVLAVRKLIESWQEALETPQPTLLPLPQLGLIRPPGGQP